MKKFKTREIYYTGCNPDIAEALMQNKEILCDVGAKAGSVYITRYKWGTRCPYIDYKGNRYAEATPVETVRYVKKAPVIVKWLEYNRYEPDECGNWRRHGYKTFAACMFRFCGKPMPECYGWLDEWLKEK